MIRTPSRIYQEISGETFAPKFSCGWAHIQLWPSAPYSIRDERSAYTFGLAFERQQGVHAVHRDQRRDFDAWPGEFACTAPNVEIFSESAIGGEYLTVHAMLAPTDVTHTSSSASPRIVFRGDRQAVRLGWHLRRLLLAPMREPRAIEECAALLVDHGISRVATPGRSSGRYDVDRDAHARVLERIEDCLDGPLPLEGLAHAAGLPLLRFLRSFVATFGATPHAYITERRVQRARKRLRSGDESLAAIAADCGFAHQSHLGAVLKNRLGLSPRQYRALAIHSV
jgi:AraC family transcriptional regulator